LPDSDRDEIRQAFDRLINKLLHPPLESLRTESQAGPPLGLIEALKRLFQLRD
jgi:glutamyl-tRNA reductase